MSRHFPRPDRYIGRCGHLNASVAQRRVGGAPGFMRGLRAAFVSDTHVRPCATRAELEALVQSVAALSPDLLLLGGDYADDAEDAVRLFEALGALKPPLGAFGVIGNNDAEAWDGRLGELKKVMRRAGYRLLINSRARLPVGGGTLYITGVDEYKWGKPSARGLYPEARRPDAYRLLLSHYPAMPNVMPDVMLCGHTHGGQFNLLGLTPFAVGFERIRPPRVAALAVSGQFDLGGMRLLVSKGVGASRLQLRVGVRPEIELITFE